jgi:hypothetical protein
MISRMMNTEAFDPVSVERVMVERRVLGPRADPSPGALAELERHFTEDDPRKYALWRISMVRQFQPAVLKRLSDDDLVYLAGQSPEGYSGHEVFGVQLDRNKIAQNALRARVEVDTRATRGAWRRSITLGLSSLIIGAVLSTVTAWLT